MANKIAGMKGDYLDPQDIKRIQQTNPGLSLNEIKHRAIDKGVKIRPETYKIFEKDEKEEKAKSEGRIENIVKNLGPSTPVEPGGPPIPEGYSTLPEIESSLYLSNLRNTKEIEKLRDAGATERLKYEVDNRIPEIKAESQGKVNLQKIVNAGYKNIANIERGREMVRSITSMFNF